MWVLKSLGTRDMVTQSGLLKSLRVWMGCRLTSPSSRPVGHVGHSLDQISEENNLHNFQSVLRVHSGRRRPGHAKDWTKENTQKIDWGRLNTFMKRHAKALEGYIGETFQ